MEYFALVLNRTFVVTIDDERLSGTRCRGLTSVASGGNAVTLALTSGLAVHGDLASPGSYVDEHLLRSGSSASFIIPLRDISTIEYYPRKKWGMGHYPHSGRVFIGTGGRTREFIIVGKQSGAGIFARLKAAVELADRSFNADASGAAQPQRWDP